MDSPYFEENIHSTVGVFHVALRVCRADRGRVVKTPSSVLIDANDCSAGHTYPWNDDIQEELHDVLPMKRMMNYNAVQNTTRTSVGKAELHLHWSTIQVPALYLVTRGTVVWCKGHAKRGIGAENVVLTRHVLNLPCRLLLNRNEVNRNGDRRRHHWMSHAGAYREGTN